MTEIIINKHDAPRCPRCKSKMWYIASDYRAEFWKCPNDGVIAEIEFPSKDS